MNFQDIIRESYDGDNRALKTVAVGASGQVTVSLYGNTTIVHGSNVTLNSSNANIGSVSVLGGSLGLVGNITLSDPKTFIGLVTSVNGAGDRYIGLVTNTTVGLVTTIQTGNSTIIHGSNVTLNASNADIGSVSILGGSLSLVGSTTLIDAKSYIGLVTSTLGVGTTFIGLTTSWSRNAGSAKTLTPYSLNLSTSSVVTIAVPTNNQSMYITNMVLSSDATVRVSIKSGVTYMTGNASLGITLNPGGGFIQTGAPDSPSWIGLPSGALVVEKFDMTGTKANIGGTLVTFTE